MSLDYRTLRVLIWGKTYPELSNHHLETVCTGGCLEDGTPVRLYPVPFRYLEGPDQYELYTWIQVDVARNPRDRRPESFKVRPDRIVVQESLGTKAGWADRKRIIFRDPRWHFGCLDDLRVAQRIEKRSMGVVPVGSVDEVTLERRSEDSARLHEEKLQALRERQDMFAPEPKALAFVPYRVRVRWRCRDGANCPGHSASIMDWGLIELARKTSPESARQKMESLADLSRYDLHLFMGNIHRRPKTFTCIGLWYPLRSAVSTQGELDL